MGKLKKGKVLMDNLEKELFDSIAKCNICDVSLVGVAKAKIDKGVKLKDVLEWIVSAQRQMGHIEYSVPALKSRYYRELGDDPGKLQNATSEPTKTQEATKIVNSMVEKYKKPKMPSEFQDDIDVQVNKASQDTVTSMLVDTEINDRVNKAFKMLDEVIGAWELTGKTFWLDLDYLKLNLERIQKKVRSHVDAAYESISRSD